MLSHVLPDPVAHECREINNHNIMFGGIHKLLPDLIYTRD